MDFCQGKRFGVMKKRGYRKEGAKSSAEREMKGVFQPRRKKREDLRARQRNAIQQKGRKESGKKNF